MRIISIKIPQKHRLFLFLFLATSWVTGITFYILNRWFMVEGMFGPEKHPWQFTILQIHGIAAFGMLMAYGAILANHVPQSWKANRLRGIGVLLLTAFSSQVITAYLLYYLANENGRTITSNIHTIIGLILPLILGIHIWLGIKTKRQNHRTMPR